MGQRTVVIYSCDWCDREAQDVSMWSEPCEGREPRLLCPRCTDKYNAALKFARESEYTPRVAISEFYKVGRDEGVLEAYNLFEKSSEEAKRIIALLEKKRETPAATKP